MTTHPRNDGIRTTPGEDDELRDATASQPAPVPNEVAPKEAVEFLHVLIEENASISGDVVQLEEHLWAVHGHIAVDGDVLMAEFDSYEQATNALDQLRREDA